MTLDDLRDKVIVLTGASSGIGRAAAIAFAALGATVVAAARREDALEETVLLCRSAGGTVIPVVADVTQEEDVNRIVEAALRQGGIDVWVNNAGTTLFGSLEEAPFDQHRRVIETNLFGPMLAARAVIPVFRRQKRGIMINVGSILSKVGQPFVPSYVISKFALNGLSRTLRTELADERDIHVCTLLPYTVDTPHFEAGASHVGREAHAMPPVQSPEKVAEALVRLARRPRRELHVPRSAALWIRLYGLMPRTAERLILHGLRTWHFGAAEAANEGNLFEPGAETPAAHGKRRPLLGTPLALAWAARELLRIEADSARYHWRRWRSA